MTDTRKLHFTDAKSGQERVIEVSMNLAMMMVQTMHIAGVDAYIEFTAADVVAA